jgi:hypothetical protein
MRGTFKVAVKRAVSASSVAVPPAAATVLPSQLAHAHWRQCTPEMRLVAAVLEDALLLVTRQAGVRRGRRRKDFLDAWNWLWNERRDWPFAFQNVCDLLALDASAVRRRVQRVLAARDAQQQRVVNGEHLLQSRTNAAG